MCAATEHSHGSINVVDAYTEALGEVVRAEVAALNLSTKDIEKRLGVSYPSYWRYFKSGDRSPSLEQLSSVAHGLGMTPVELLQRVEARIKQRR